MNGKVFAKSMIIVAFGSILAWLIRIGFVFTWGTNDTSKWTMDGRGLMAIMCIGCILVSMLLAGAYYFDKTVKK